MSEHENGSNVVVGTWAGTEAADIGDASALLVANGFDLGEQEQEQQAENNPTDVHIQDLRRRPMYGKENGQVVPVIIRVYGTHSDAATKEDERIRKRKLDGQSLTGQRFYDDAIERAAACTHSWQGITYNGKWVEDASQPSGRRFEPGPPLRCDRANAAAFYNKFPHVLRQVQDAMEDHERFTKGS